MNKQELVQKLREVAESERQYSSQNSDFANYLAGYVERLDLSYFEKFKHINFNIEDKLQQIVVGCVAEIRRLRVDPPKDLGYGEIADFEKIYCFDDREKFDGLDVYGAAIAKTVVRLVTQSDKIVEHLDKVLRPDWHAIHAAFFRFLDVAYSRGLYQEIRDNYPKTTEKKFGQTTLQGWEFAGRICVKFVRGDPDNHPEHVIVFTCDTGDVHGFGAGLTANHADLSVALTMIDEVVTNWPTNAKVR
jgi:hypothetical protein